MAFLLDQPPRMTPSFDWGVTHNVLLTIQIGLYFRWGHAQSDVKAQTEGVLAVEKIHRIIPLSFDAMALLAPLTLRRPRSWAKHLGVVGF